MTCTCKMVMFACCYLLTDCKKGEQMKTGTHGFSEEDIRNIDEVIAALRELVGITL